MTQKATVKLAALSSGLLVNHGVVDLVQDIQPHHYDFPKPYSLKPYNPKPLNPKP